MQRLYTRLAALLVLVSIANFSAQAQQVTVLTSTTHLPRNVAEPVFFTAYGCDGQVTWLNFLQEPIGTSNVSQDTPGFQGTNTYFVKCGNNAPIRFFIDKTRIERSTTPIISADRTTINAGETVTLTAPNCLGVVTWMSGNFVLSKDASYIATPTTNTTYTALCTESTRSVSLPSQETVTIRVENPSLPAPIINTRDLTGVVQIGQATELGAFNCFYTVNWLKNGDGIGSGTTITVTAAANDIYTATCSNEGVVSPASNAITTPGAIPSIQNELMNRTVCLNGSTTFQIESTGATSFQWQFNNQNISGANSSSYTISQVTEAQVGSYRVIVSNASGSVTSNSASVSLFAPISLSMSSTPATCFLGSNGTATAVASNGVAPYTYTWSNGATGSMISGLSAGSYTVNVTDLNGCSSSNSVTVTQPGLPIAIELTSTPVSCFGGINGTATAVASRGTEPYTFTWSNEAFGATVINLAAGNYTVTATDANGCTASNTVNVFQPGLLVPVITNQPVICHGGNQGSAFVSVSGGTLPYAFRWSNAFTGVNPTGLTAGTYSVTVIDGNGCTSAESTTITQPQPLVYSFVKEDVKCFGGNDGKIEVNPTGGTAPYQMIANGQSFSLSNQIFRADTYQINVRDANNCLSGVNTVVIQQPSSPVTAQLIDAKSPRGFGLTDGSVSVEIKGGTGPFSSFSTVWTWDGGPNTSEVKSEINGTLRTTLERAGGGNYQLRVTDAQFSSALSKEGCTTTLNYFLTQPEKITAITAVDKGVSCFGKFDGQLSANVKGGVIIEEANPYKYAWFRKENETLINLNETTNRLVNVDAGRYVLRVTDKNDIIENFEIDLKVTPSLVTSLVRSENPTCVTSTDGIIEIQTVGGVAPLTVDWGGGLFGSRIQNLQAGSYFGVVRDKEGCTGEIAVALSPKEDVKVSVLKKTDLICRDVCEGAIELQVSGNTSPFRIEWSQRLFGNALSDSDPQASIQNLIGNGLTNLCAGEYAATITTELGCKASTNSIILANPEATTINVSDDLIVCADANLELDAASIVPSTSYQWTSPSGQVSSASLIAIRENGNYKLEVTDAKGCKASDTFGVQIVNATSGLLFTVASEGKVNEPMYAINLTATSVPTTWRITGPATVMRQESGLLVINPTGLGTVRIELATSAGGCASNILRTVQITDGVVATTQKPETEEEIEVVASSEMAEKISENSFIIYPNPSSGSFYVKTEGLGVEKASIRILESTMYRQVYAEDFDTIDERGVPIDLESYRLKEGNYYLIIVVNNQRFVKRLHIRETY